MIALFRLFPTRATLRAGLGRLATSLGQATANRTLRRGVPAREAGAGAVGTFRDVCAWTFPGGAAVLLGLATAPFVSAAVYDVKSYGARGDGETLDTPAIQKAMDDCARAGGGVVYFPAGRFLSATINLRSHVTLELSPGAVLWSSPRLADFPVKRHLIFADHVEDVAIVGGGAIDGHGEVYFDGDMKPAAQRPNQLIEIEHSRGVRLQNVTVRNAANWTFRVRSCDDVKVTGVSMLNNVRAVNTDGLQIDSSRNVIISDCRIEGGDDCIVLKTDVADGENPTENVTVTNCVLVSAASALKLGTGSSRDFRHCLFTNCVIRDSRTGIALMQKDGGTMEDIRFSNITITTRPKWGQGLEWPIVVDIERRTNASPLGKIRDVSFDGIAIYSKGRVLVEGMPASPVSGIAFRDVALHVTGFERIEGGRKPRGGPHGASDDSPDFGAAPAAFVVAHALDVTFSDVSVLWPETASAPLRHALWAKDVRGLQSAGLRATASRPGLPAIKLEDSNPP